MLPSDAQVQQTVNVALKHNINGTELQQRKLYTNT